MVTLVIIHNCDNGYVIKYNYSSVALFFASIPYSCMCSSAAARPQTATEKPVSKVAPENACVVCKKVVYITEKVEVDGAKYHKGFDCIMWSDNVE